MEKDSIQPQKQSKKRLPVTVLSGFLGSGKTTLMNYILRERHGYKIALIVNDMSEVNIDSQIINNGSAINRVEEKLVEMQNGCICCTLREDLILQIKKLAKKQKFDYLMIESTGISEPLPVAQAFTFTDEQGFTLNKIARLDTMVTVVDAFNFYNHLTSIEKVQERVMQGKKEIVNEIPLAQLLIDQIEFANVVVLNKKDLISQSELSTIMAGIKKLNPSADVVVSERSQIPLKLIINTQKFDFEKAQMSAGWLLELAKPRHVPETEEYGISSFVYEARKPFNPEKLFEFLTKTPSMFQSCIRSKGFLWCATRHSYALWFSQCGEIIEYGAEQLWYAEIPMEKWMSSGEDEMYIDTNVQQKWMEPYGDRRQEFVMIGVQMDKKAMRDYLDSCLIEDEHLQLGPQKWSEMFKDPFPQEWNDDIQKDLRHFHQDDEHDPEHGEWEDCLEMDDNEDDDEDEDMEEEEEKGASQIQVK